MPSREEADVECFQYTRAWPLSAFSSLVVVYCNLKELKIDFGGENWRKQENISTELKQMSSGSMASGDRNQQKIVKLWSVDCWVGVCRADTEVIEVIVMYRYLIEERLFVAPIPC